MKSYGLLFLIILSQAFVVEAHTTVSVDYHKVVTKFTQHKVFSGVVLVAKNGKIVFEGAYGSANETLEEENSINTKFRIGSLTKSMTAMLVVKLVQERKLSLADTVDKYLKYFPVDKGSRISIRDLLGHRSGLPRQFALPGWNEGKFERFYDKVTYAKLIGELDLLAEPGKEYLYTNLGYFLLGLIIEEVTKTTYELALDNYIFSPLKMKSTGGNGYDVSKNRATGYRIGKHGGYHIPSFLNVEFLFLASGNLYSTVGDILKFEQALYRDIILDKKHIGILLSKENGFSWYRESWKIGENSKGHSTVNWGGEIPGYSSFLLRFVDENSTIIILSNNAISEVEKRRLANELASILYNEDIDSTKLPLSFVLTKALYVNELDKKITEVLEHIQNYIVDESLASLGLQLMWGGDLEKAMLVLSLNAKLLPDSPVSHDSLAQVFEEKKEFSEALKSTMRAFELLPNNKYLQSKIKRLTAIINCK